MTSHRFTMLALALLLAACGSSPAPAGLPTAHVMLATAGPVRAAAIPTATPTVTPTLAPTATTTPTATPQPAAPLDQYRAWMEEARALHPYAEPVETMWAVMICESSGNPDLVTGPYHGLFQYQLATWAGDWNPYRDRSILDPRAQIFATAKAWQDGHQTWWGCYQA